MRGMTWKRGIGGLLGVGLTLVLLQGCDSLTGTDTPTRARLVLSDQTGALPVELTTSLNFLVGEGGNLSFEDLTVDTVSVPFDETYNIEQHQRFYIMATNIQDETQSFRMKVTIDGRSWYDEVKTLAPEETAQFVYRYQDPRVF